MTLTGIGYPAAALAVLADRLEGCGALWVIGGSTGLAIRGAELGCPPRDLDVYADEKDVPALHRRLAAEAVDVPMPNQTERYRSVLSHYAIEGTIVELVGGFRIMTGGSSYNTEVRRRLYPAGETFRLERGSVRIVPLAHELLFNVLRERVDRAEMIGKLIQKDPHRHLPALEELLRHNQISKDTETRVRFYAPGGADGRKAELE